MRFGASVAVCLVAAACLSSMASADFAWNNCSYSYRIGTNSFYLNFTSLAANPIAESGAAVMRVTEPVYLPGHAAAVQSYAVQPCNGTGMSCGASGTAAWACAFLADGSSVGLGYWFPGEVTKTLLPDNRGVSLESHNGDHSPCCAQTTLRIKCGTTSSLAGGLVSSGVYGFTLSTPIGCPDQTAEAIDTLNIIPRPCFYIASGKKYNLLNAYGLHNLTLGSTTYRVDVCRRSVEPKCRALGGMACAYDSTTGQIREVLASWSATTSRPTATSGPIFAAAPTHGGRLVVGKSTIDVICAETTGPLALVSVVKDKYHFQFESPAGCPVSSDSDSDSDSWASNTEEPAVQVEPLS